MKLHPQEFYTSLPAYGIFDDEWLRDKFEGDIQVISNAVKVLFKYEDVLQKKVIEDLYANGASQDKQLVDNCEYLYSLIECPETWQRLKQTVNVKDSDNDDCIDDFYIDEIDNTLGIVSVILEEYEEKICKYINIYLAEFNYLKLVVIESEKETYN